MAAVDAENRVERLAELLVGFGANVQPDQIVAVGAEVGQEELARAVAEQAYLRGARYVDAVYFDPWVKRARIAHAAEETLSFVPSWYGARLLALGEQRCARVHLAGTPSPGVLDGLDPARAGRDQLPFLKEVMTVIDARTTNWTIGPAPTPGWAGLVFPELESDAALERLWEDIIHVCRLDEPDPVAAWEERSAALVGSAERLSERRFDAVHFQGPGTDLTVGLLPSSTWGAARFETVDGIVHMPNLPTEEVFTSPDPERTEGSVRSTKPLLLQDGTFIRDLEVRFEHGRVTGLEASAGAEALRGRTAFDEGAARLGEVALVDREGRIGRLDHVFYNTLLDENAASHIALGGAFESAVGEADVPRLNRSGIHIDFMIGGDDVDVTGLTRAGERVPVLRGGAWQI